MIKIRLKEVLKDMSQRELAKRTGLRPNTINELYNERAKRIDFETISLLCRELDCQPGDLFVYVPDEESSTSYESK